jgi:hypothetical protein
VYEAVQPVKLTPFAEWTARGPDGHFVVKRLRDTRVLTPQVLKRMRAIGEEYRGKSYGDRVPRDEPVISPAAMFDSDKLVEVVRR